MILNKKKKNLRFVVFSLAFLKPALVWAQPLPHASGVGDSFANIRAQNSLSISNGTLDRFSQVGQRNHSGLSSLSHAPQTSGVGDSFANIRTQHQQSGTSNGALDRFGQPVQRNHSGLSSLSPAPPTSGVGNSFANVRALQEQSSADVTSDRIRQRLYEDETENSSFNHEFSTRARMFHHSVVSGLNSDSSSSNRSNPVNLPISQVQRERENEAAEQEQLAAPQARDNQAGPAAAPVALHENAVQARPVEVRLGAEEARRNPPAANARSSLVKNQHYTLIQASDVKLEEREELECVICLENLFKQIESNQPVALLNCGGKHMFCEECIQKEFTSRPQCPVCRRAAQSLH